MFPRPGVQRDYSEGEKDIIFVVFNSLKMKHEVCTGKMSPAHQVMAVKQLGPYC